MMKQRWQLSGIILLAASLFGLLSPASSQAAGIQVVSAPGDSQHAIRTWPGGTGISADGRYALFASDRDEIPANSWARQLFRRDLQTQAVELVTSLDGGRTALNMGTYYVPKTSLSILDAPDNMISQEGRYVVFVANIPELVEVNTSQVFRRDMVTGAVDLVSAQDGNSTPVESTPWQQHPRISADGRYVLFISDSPDLPDYNGKNQVYRRDMQTLRTETVRIEDPYTVYDALDISADGRYVLIFSPGNPGAIFRRDMQTQTLDMLSGFSNEGDGYYFNVGIAKMSADGRYIVFTANDLDGAYSWQLYRLDMQTRQIVRVSAADGSSVLGGFSPTAFAISGNGRYVSFFDGWSKVYYRRDIDTQRTILISSPDGVTPAQGSDREYGNSVLESYLSFDGSKIVFTYNATNLVPPNDYPAVYVWQETPFPQPPSTHADVTTETVDGVTLTTINGQLVPYTEHVGKNASVFVFANVIGTDDWLLLNPLTGWHPWVDCNSTAFPYAMHESMPWVTDIALFYNADLSPFRGWPILFGYGVGSDKTSACLDMFNNSRYTRVAIL